MTTINRSIPSVVPRPKCSRPASISRITTSSLLKTRWLIMRFNITCSGQTHPPPPVSTVPITSNFTPLQVFEYVSGISSTFGLILKNFPSPLAPVLSWTSFLILEIGIMESNTSSSNPSANPRFASGSTSAANTLLPSSA